MALSHFSTQAIERLRAYAPPPTRYNDLPLSRRAAVLILLYPDKKGDLRVVLTMRASTMNSYAGQAALPGGKSDALEETPWDTARREAFEEIGLPLDDSKLPAPFRIEHLCELPMNLARTELGVRPCVAFISATTPPSSSSPSANQSIPAVEDILIPRLNAKEVAAVFTAPFHNFLRTVDEESYASTSAEPEAGAEAAGFPASWYNGSWTDWHDIQWRMHNFYVPVANQIVRKPKSKPKPLVSPLPYADQVKMNEEDPLDKMKRFRVFGMTARILVDAARVAYDEEPEFEHNSHFGDEDMIGRLLKIGRLGAIKKSDDQITREDLAAAAKI